MTQNLRYDLISDQTRDRWAKLLASSRRDLTERMRRLIRIALDACDSIGPPKMQARLVEGGTALWVLCPQAELAELLDCSDRTLRNEFERLADLQALKTVPHKTIANLVAYRFEFTALESFQESLTPELDEIICEFMESICEAAGVADSVTVSGDSADGSSVVVSVPVSASVSGQISGGFSGPVSGQISGGFSGPVSGQISGGFSGPVSGQISALMNHDHDGLNEFNNSSITHDHERPRSDADPDVRRFDVISQRDVLAIAGYEIDVDGVPRKASLASRRRVQLEYFDDAVRAGQALPTEALAFAALFRCAARLNRKPEGERGRVNDCASWIRTVWTNRNERPCQRIIADDKAYARDLLSCQ